MMEQCSMLITCVRTESLLHTSSTYQVSSEVFN